MASLLELLDRHDRHYVAAHKKKGSRLMKALRVPRPRDLRRRRNRRNATGTELAAMMGKLGGAVVGVERKSGGSKIGNLLRRKGGDDGGD